MYLAAIDFGSIDTDVITRGVISSVLYFVVGIAVLALGFVMVDALTPGKLRRQVFVERRPNAVALASAMYASLAVVIIAAIHSSSDTLGQGLVDTAAYGLLGVVLQGMALVILEMVVPGRFRDHIDDEQLQPAAIATAVVLLAVGGINAAALS